jgi:hypothetical protein
MNAEHEAIAHEWSDRIHDRFEGATVHHEDES